MIRKKQSWDCTSSEKCLERLKRQPNLYLNTSLRVVTLVFFLQERFSWECWSWKTPKSKNTLKNMSRLGCLENIYFTHSCCLLDCKMSDASKTSPYGNSKCGYATATSDYCTSLITKTLIYCTLIAVGALFPVYNKRPCGLKNMQSQSSASQSRLLNR